jgi:hypothetical protein
MRRLSLALCLALGALAGSARAAGLGFVYVSPNVGLSSGGHAALVADGTVYHLQNSDEGLLLLVREGWLAFHLVYADLENRPMVVARVDAAPEVTERVQGAFSKLYVEQELALARRDSLRADVAWLEAFANGRPAPPLRGLGLLDPESPGDPDAIWLRALTHARAGGDSVARVEQEADREVARITAAADARALAALRDALTLREAARALDRGLGLDPAALAPLPADESAPLTPAERAGLEQLSSQLENTVAELIRSKRPDRGYALLLAQARYLATRRSLASNHLQLLDAFAGSELPVSPRDDVPDDVREKRRTQAAELVGRGRADVLVQGRIDEPNFNLLEEIAAIAARGGRADAAGELSELGQRKLPGRSRAIAVTAFGGDLTAGLRDARARLAAHEQSLKARWSYDLFRHNCITELARVTDGAFGTREEAVAALGATASPDDELLGFIPFVFFDRVERELRVTQAAYYPNRRERELTQLLARDPSALTRARESTAYTSSSYAPLLRDSAFFLFTDDVFWRRPAYGGVNLLFELGYTGYGLLALPFDGGARAKAGLEGMVWSMPELFFMNVRKGTFDTD